MLITTSFTLKPLPPFRLDLTAWVLKRRPFNSIEDWDGQTYRRVLILNGEPTIVTVTQLDNEHQQQQQQQQLAGSPEIRINIYQNGNKNSREVTDSVTAIVKEETITQLKRILGIYIDLTDFYRKVIKSPQPYNEHLVPIVIRFRGMKPPRFPSIFECLINAFACQQVSLTLGIRLLNRLTAKCGLRPAMTNSSSNRPELYLHAFPQPKDILRLEMPEQELRNIGFSTQKVRAILELCQIVDEKRLGLEMLETIENDDEIIRILCNLRGVGRWTAEYVLLRGLGRLHVFPGDDVGAKKNLQKSLQITRPLSYVEVKEIAGKWYPYGGLMYFHLLLEHLLSKGWLNYN